MMSGWTLSIYFQGHWSKVKFIDKCWVCGVYCYINPLQPEICQSIYLCQFIIAVYILFFHMLWYIYVTFLKISFFRKPRKIFWTVFSVFTSHIHKCAKYCVTLYCPLTAGTANIILPGENFGIERTPLWTNDSHLTVPATLLMTSRESAGVTLPVTPRISDRFFKRFHEWKCNITVISLLLGKYTRTFVPQFPGIPEMLYFPPPLVSGNITSRGFLGTSGQHSGIFPSKQWNNCIIFIKQIQQYSQNACYKYL